MNVAIIPARGGSKRIPRKNVRPFCGIPIIAYSIRLAQDARFERVIVSTDDDDVARIAKFFGAEIHRRGCELAFDSVGTQDVTAAVLKELAPDAVGDDDYACCIYATAPLAEVEDLKQAKTLLDSQPGAQTSFAFAAGADPLRDAGQFYYGRIVSFILNTPVFGPRSRMVVVPDERVCDINEEQDWARAEQMYRRVLQKAAA